MRFLILVLITFLGLPHAGDFDEPECMQAAIGFWEKVYTVYDQDQFIAHNPETFQIYGVIRKGRTPTIQRMQMKQFIDSMERSQPGVEIRFQSGVKTRFNEGLSRHMKYKHTIVRELDKQGLPRELQLLPHVESSYDPRARSYCGARGLWQIMPRTARMFKGRGKNLSNVESATPIAVRILKYNYQQTGSWPMALMSYNYGLVGVKRAMIDLGTDDVCIVIDKHSSRTFKFASKNFYAEFLAVKRIIDCREPQ